MAFVIRSLDGRTSISTASIEAAAAHVKRLASEGIETELTGMHGGRYKLADLLEEAEARKADGLGAAQQTDVKTLPRTF